MIRSAAWKKAAVAVTLAVAALPLVQGVAQAATASEYSTLAVANISRNDVLTRSQSWIDERVPYSQSAYHSNRFGKYRQDCSGYVSMAWGLSSSLSTASLPNVSSAIARSALAPGDILWRRDSKVHHVAIFVRWADGAHTSPVVREEYSTGHVAEQRTWKAAYANTFQPRRYNNISG